MSAQPWWAQVPWDHLAFLAFVFWLGQMFNDAFNEHSWLRHNWRVMRSLGDFHSVEYAVRFLEREPGRDDKAHFIEIAVPFTFDRNAGSDVQIRVTYDKVIGPQGLAPQYNWRHPLKDSVLRGDRISVPIAFVADEPGVPGLTGDRQLRCLGLSTAYRIKIEMFCGWRRQSKRLLLKIPHRQERISVEKDHYEGSFFFLIDEDELLWPDD